MKTYKLIKEYPGSPKLGCVQIEDHYRRDYPEFWEEIVDKVPEYVKWVKNIGSSGTGWLCGEGDFKLNKIFNTTKDDFPFNIVSWGEALTDKWYPKNFVPATKEEYDLQNRIPLFTTEDNIPIYEGDEYWWVRVDNANKDEPIWSFGLFSKERDWSNISLSDCYKRFSTSTGAQEYINNNKPIYSLKDVEQMFIKSGYQAPYYKHNLEILKNLKK